MNLLHYYRRHFIGFWKPTEGGMWSLYMNVRGTGRLYKFHGEPPNRRDLGYSRYQQDLAILDVWKNYHGPFPDGMKLPLNDDSTKVFLRNVIDTVMKLDENA